MAKKTTLPVETKRAPKVKFVLVEYSLTGQRTYVSMDIVPKLLMAGCRLVRPELSNLALPSNTKGPGA